MDRIDQLTNLLHQHDSKQSSPLLAGLSHPKYQPLTMLTMVQPEPPRLCYWTKILFILNLAFVGLFMTLLVTLYFQPEMATNLSHMPAFLKAESFPVDLPKALPYRSFRLETQEARETGSKRIEPSLLDHRFNLGLIVNGDEVPETEAKFQVQLRQVDVTSGLDTFCGGTLISSRYVLTAAHCFNDKLPVSTLSVRYGTHSSSSSEYQDVKIAKAIKHPWYNEKYSHNDIAIIKLAKKIAPANNVEYAEMDFGTLPAQEQVQIYGFGLESGTSPTISTSLRKATLETLTIRECNQLLRSANFPNDPKVVCAHSQTQISCSGDSGGGLFNAEGKLAGITSLVESGCRPGGVAVFTRISSHYLFIQMHTKLWIL